MKGCKYPDAQHNIQAKTVETTLAAIQDDNDATLPPLMNPTVLEASDDLTNLSHLNEPAGMSQTTFSFSQKQPLTQQ